MHDQVGAAPPGLAAEEEQRLDPRAIVVRRIAGGIGSMFVAGASFVGLLTALLASAPSRVQVALGLLGWFALLVALGAWSWYWPPVWYRHVSYRIDEQGLRIRSGVFWRSMLSIPRSRVQHTDVRQGPVERSFGLATLILHTAGTQHASVELSGLDREAALGIRDRLIAVDG